MAVFVLLLYFYTVMAIEKKKKFSTESTKIRYFDLKIKKIFWREGTALSRPLFLWAGGHHLPTPHPLFRLRRLDSAYAFDARLCPPTSTTGFAYVGT